MRLCPVGLCVGHLLGQAAALITRSAERGNLALSLDTGQAALLNVDELPERVDVIGGNQALGVSCSLDFVALFREILLHLPDLVYSGADLFFSLNQLSL